MKVGVAKSNGNPPLKKRMFLRSEVLVNSMKYCMYDNTQLYDICLKCCDYGGVVNMFDFHRNDWGSNPGLGCKIS